MRSALLELVIHGQHCWSRGGMRSALLELVIHEVSTAGAGDM